jgi:DNA transformation protein and related proteins
MAENTMQRTEFLEYVMEQLAFVPDLRVRSMFSGHGIYHGELMFAMIVNDTFYLKVDAEIQADFKEKGLMPFSYSARGKSVTIQYYEAPASVFEDSEIMREWIEKAFGAALRQHSLSSNKKRKLNVLQKTS